MAPPGPRSSRRHPLPKSPTPSFASRSFKGLPLAVCLDQDGNVFVAGKFSGLKDFTRGAVAAAGHGGEQDGFATRYNRDGTTLGREPLAAGRRQTFAPDHRRGNACRGRELRRPCCRSRHERVKRPAPKGVRPCGCTDILMRPMGCRQGNLRQTGNAFLVVRCTNDICGLPHNPGLSGNEEYAAAFCINPADGRVRVRLGDGGLQSSATRAAGPCRPLSSMNESDAEPFRCADDGVPTCSAVARGPC